MKTLYYSILSLMLPVYGFAQVPTTSNQWEETGKQEAVQDKQENSKGSFAFSGYLDSYYMTNLNKPASRSNLGVAGTARVFDQRSEQFSLGLVQTKMIYTNAKAEAVVDLAFGPNANMGNYGNALASTALNIKQAYFTYNFTDKFSMTAGQFGTIIGYEVIDAPSNYHYSLSNQFNNGPFYHAGVKATYAFNDRVSWMVGVINNVDGLGDNNSKKGIISQLFLVPVKDWNVYLNFIGSNEADELNGVTPKASYTMFDIASTYQVSDRVALGVNASYGAQKGDFQGGGGPTTTKSWGGLAFYGNTAITDHFGIGARYEYFNNESGVRGLVAFPNGMEKPTRGTHVNSLTITGNISLADDHILVKPEFRLDAYPRAQSAGELQQFEDSKGDFSKNSQATLGIALICKF